MEKEKRKREIFFKWGLKIGARITTELPFHTELKFQD